MIIRCIQNSIGEWKPWKEVIDLKLKSETTKKSSVGSKAKNMVSGLLDAGEKYSLSLDGEIVIKDVSL